MSLPHFEFGPKTVFSHPPCREAILVIRVGKDHTHRHLKFAGPHELIDYCIANGAALVLTPGREPVNN
jgi:hypothetical protein